MYNFFENKKIIEYPVIDMEATGNHIKKLRKNANFSVKELKEILKDFPWEDRTKNI